MSRQYQIFFASVSTALCALSFSASAATVPPGKTVPSTPITTASSTPSMRSPIHYTPNGNIEFSSADNQFTMQAGAFGQIDLVEFINSQNVPNGVDSGGNIRRFRAHLNGTLAKDFGYMAEYDFIPNSFTNLYVSYNGIKRTTFRAGQFQPVFTLDNYSTTPEIMFMEYALPVNTFAPNFSIGGLARTYYQNFTFAGDVFVPRQGTTVTGDDPLGVSARVTYSPVHTATKVWHFGLAYLYQDVDNIDGASFSTTPEAQARNTTAVLNTGSIANSHNYSSLGLEAANVWGPFSAQFESIETWVNRKLSSDLHFWGSYLSAGYFLTGESLVYDFPSASFDGISPINNPQLGAWQIAGRLSYLDLNSKNIQGGRETDTTLGLNWYLNKRLRFLFNYVYANYGDTYQGNRAHSNILGVRMQVTL